MGKDVHCVILIMGGCIMTQLDHCNHECEGEVCRLYSDFDRIQNMPCSLTCRYDTRARKSPLTSSSDLLITTVQKYISEIRLASEGMRYLSDIEILNRTMPVIIALFRAEKSRKDNFECFDNPKQRGGDKW